MSAVEKFNQLIRQRAQENEARDHGFEICAVEGCGNWTDGKDADGEPCCETCCADAGREIESEQRHNDPRHW